MISLVLLFWLEKITATNSPGPGGEPFHCSMVESIKNRLKNVCQVSSHLWDFQSELVQVFLVVQMSQVLRCCSEDLHRLGSWQLPRSEKWNWRFQANSLRNISDHVLHPIISLVHPSNASKWDISQFLPHLVHHHLDLLVHSNIIQVVMLEDVAM